MFTKETKKLQARYGNQKSYNGKAKIETTQNIDVGGPIEYRKEMLLSYDTGIIWAYQEGNKETLYYTNGKAWKALSATTRRHVIEYWRQYYGAYYRKDNAGYYSRGVDDVTIKKLIGAAFDMIGAANTGGLEVTWLDIYRMQEYADSIEYSIGGKAWRATIENVCNALKHGVPLDDVLA